MPRRTAERKPLTEAQLLTELAANSGATRKQVAAILVALGAEIERSLGSKGAGVITIPGVVKIEKVQVRTCPTWPNSVKVTVVPELLPGPDDRCAHGLHTYHRSPATNDCGHPTCALCGKDKVDWERLHQRRITDIEHTAAQLQTDRFRRKWWLQDLDEKATRHARRKGPRGIKDAVRYRVEQSLSRVYKMTNGKVQPFNDGKQTPYEGNVIYYGQHATATCCRECLHVWHGIPLGRELTERESAYVVGLLLEYIRFKLPELGKSRLTHSHRQNGMAGR